jgi:hypothetical protein
VAGPYLNRGEIISEGLALGGNPGLTTRARVLLNTVINRLEHAYAWEHLQKEDTSLATAASSEVISLSGISDLGAIVEVWQDGASDDSPDNKPLVMVPWRAISTPVNVMRSQGTTGRPRRVAHDRNGNRLILYPIPDKVRSLRMLYMSYTAEQDTSNTTTYDADTPTFPYTWVLKNAVAEFARRWDTDSLANLSRLITQEAVEDALMFEQTNRSHSVQLTLDPAVHGTWAGDSYQDRWPKES